MASVYKTLSGTNSHDKENVEKKNRQRVLILVQSALDNLVSTG